MRQANTPACLIFFFEGSFGDASLPRWHRKPVAVRWRNLLEPVRPDPN